MQECSRESDGSQSGRTIWKINEATGVLQVKTPLFQVN